jgi:predicted TIM-barrel enzyme
MANEYDAKFIQLDSVQTPDLDISKYDSLREKYPQVVVLGGVGFKYTKPTGNPLEVDLREGKSRCEAIVTTGPGTGIETPTDKLKDYKNILGDFPLIVGAGVNIRNIYSQLSVADGAIIGSYIKNGNTEAPIDKFLVAGIVKEVDRLRKSILKS